ncbi:hypothetical protein HPP92_016449 [Vanilla planifolia]|uniref:Protein kinase domain-containing protein n=1 Tax=Vanilla planifolia TaxID=51239 RepID=A0A835QNP7_VANPL|nr:hypothetical protein HPP92_016449 [Vanilla planifolia]
MEATLTRLFSIVILPLLLINLVCSVNADSINLVLNSFLQKLSPNNPHIDRNLGWNASSDPCLAGWRGISCKKDDKSIRSIVLESLDLDGSIDANILSLMCNATSLSVLNLQNNSLVGNLPGNIGGCTKLTHIFLSNNRLSGSLPSTLPNLRNLKVLDVSNNNFSGNLPQNLSVISGLAAFLGENNRFTGTIPRFDLGYFSQFNVSFNQFSGPLPANSSKFPLSSFAGNPGLCGEPLQFSCPSPSEHKSKKKSRDKVIMILGYVLFGLALLLFLVYELVKTKKKKNKIGPFVRGEATEKKASENSRKLGSPPHSEYSISSPERSITGTSTSLFVLQRDGSKLLKFEELLRSPAELMAKGSYGSLYKVVIEGGTELAVKRIKDWSVYGEDFQKKMTKMDQARHPNVLSAAAFYCSKQEKLVVYEYQKNGSLFNLLHDNKAVRQFNWASRLHVAAGVSAGLAFMHQSLGGHGNLKSSNILFSPSMDPLISEYGLTALPTHSLDPKATDTAKPFSPAVDVYAFGVILLELLTGKPSRGFDLGQWVHAVLREEWTAEVFDRSLLATEDEGVEEAMVKLLQVALRCISSEPVARPSMAQVAAVLNGMTKEEGWPAVVQA